MRVTVNQIGKPIRVFTGVKQSTINQYITSMSEFLTRAHIKVEDDQDHVVRSLTESDHHAGEA